MKHLRILLGIVLVVAIVFSVLLSSTSIAFAESGGESSGVEGLDVTNDENQDETPIEDEPLLRLFIAGCIMVGIAFFLSLSRNKIINVICGVTESIGSIFIGIYMRFTKLAFGLAWWACMLCIIWCLCCVIVSLGTRATIRVDAEGKEHVIWEGFDVIIILSLIILPCVF